MIVRIAAEAERDLEEIGDFIAREHPERAIRFVRELRERCLLLAELPYRFELVRRYEAQGVRRQRHGNYLIFYRIEAEEVVVLHVVHGSRDYESLLFPS